jgi:hypothetical protein
MRDVAGLEVVQLARVNDRRPDLAQRAVVHNRQPEDEAGHLRTAGWCTMISQRPGALSWAPCVTPSDKRPPASRRVMTCHRRLCCLPPLFPSRP